MFDLNDNETKEFDRAILYALLKGEFTESLRKHYEPLFSRDSLNLNLKELNFIKSLIRSVFNFLSFIYLWHFGSAIFFLMIVTKVQAGNVLIAIWLYSE